MKEYIYKDLKGLDLAETLECGQCFNFTKLKEESYLIRRDKALYIASWDGRDLTVSAEGSDKEMISADGIRHFFDLDTDYSRIQREITESAPELTEVIKAHPGIRLLNQDFPETLLSFIISQNKQIPQIKQVVRNISEMFGQHIRDDIYLFPTARSLAGATEDDLRSCKAGFRAPYLIDAIKRMNAGELDAETLKGDPEAVRERLLKIKGVGPKVAGCVMLFSLGFREEFPVDVWMKRIMTDMYFQEDKSNLEIEAFGKEKFGRNAGYAQQYLFIYARENL